MRVATLVLSLLLMFPVGVQSCALAAAGGLGENENMVGGGSVGILVALLFLLGGAFAWGVPWVSFGSFLLAALLGFTTAAATPFKDLTIWAIVALALAVLSFFGAREKRKARQESAARVT